MFTFDEQRIIRTLDGADPRVRVAFALACARRLIRKLNASDEISEPTKNLLDRVVDLIRRDVAEDSPNDVDWSALLDEVMKLIPEEDATAHSNLLDDSVAGLAYALRTRLTGSSQEAAWSARRCYEYFDSVVNEDFASRGIDDVDERQLLESPIVQAELRSQHELLALVSQRGSASKEVIPQILERSR